MLKSIITLLSLAILLVVSNVVYADESNQREADARYGAQLWMNNCARCHNLRRTDEFTDREWIPIVTHMRIRAGLTGQEARDILRYLQSSNDRS